MQSQRLVRRLLEIRRTQAILELLSHESQDYMGSQLRRYLDQVCVAITVSSSAKRHQTLPPLIRVSGEVAQRLLKEDREGSHDRRALTAKDGGVFIFT